jgi:hypothetical protein
MYVKNATSGIEYVGNVQSILEEYGGRRSVIRSVDKCGYQGSQLGHLLLVPVLKRIPSVKPHR